MAFSGSYGYGSFSCEPRMRGGSTWVSGGATSGPPSTCTMLARLIAYETAWRTLTLASALLLFGERVL